MLKLTEEQKNEVLIISHFRFGWSKMKSLNLIDEYLNKYEHTFKIIFPR